MKFLLVLAATLLTAGSAFASTPGGTDSCGLGWEVTNKKSFLATTTRGTTNAFVPPTFGMTSGSIGCDQHSLAKLDMPAAQFVATNYDAVLLDMANGNGETLQALARTMGCKDESVSAFGEMTRREFSNISAASSSVEMINAIRSEMKKDAALSGCSV